MLLLLEPISSFDELRSRNDPLLFVRRLIIRAGSEETGRRSVTIGRNGRMGGHLRTIGQVVGEGGEGLGEKEGVSPKSLFLFSPVLKERVRR